MMDHPRGELEQRAMEPEATWLHRAAAVVAIGDELLSGQTLDTNSKWIAERLGQLGVRTVEHVTLGDDASAIAAALERLSGACELIVLTGGLGPTADDLTRDGVAALLREPLEVDETALGELRAWFERSGRPLRDGNERQAMRPLSARMLSNDRGTAPGIHAEVRRAGGGCDVFALPGPPFEMRAMFERVVTPALRREPGVVVRLRLARHVGIGESAAAARLGDVLERGRNPLVGITASDGVITTRIRYVGTESDADRAIDRADTLVMERLGEFRFAEGEGTIFDAAVAELRGRGEGVVFAESCTAGLLAKKFTDVPGSSAVVRAGWVCYSNAAKVEQLGVRRELLEAGGPGAVSAEVARDLALGALQRTPLEAVGSDNAEAPRRIHALSVTGIAGPGGGSDAKPVGTVFIARASAEMRRDGERLVHSAPETDVRRFRFPGDRARVRGRTAVAAAAMLMFALLDRPGVRLLWEASDDDAERRP